MTGGKQMNKEEQEHQKFLEELLEWCKVRDRILEEMESKLYKMKEIAEYSMEYELTSLEIEQLNNKLNDFKIEVDSLDKQLHRVNIPLS